MLKIYRIPDTEVQHHFLSCAAATVLIIVQFYVWVMMVGGDAAQSSYLWDNSIVQRRHQNCGVLGIGTKGIQCYPQAENDVPHELSTFQQPTSEIAMTKFCSGVTTLNWIGRLAYSK
jgi:hypothetical protein